MVFEVEIFIFSIILELVLYLEGKLRIGDESVFVGRFFFFSEWFFCFKVEFVNICIRKNMFWVLWFVCFLGLLKM